MVQRWRQASVDAEDLAGDDGGHGQGVEGVDKRLPDLDIAPPLALVVEAVHAGNIGTFMVAAQEEEVFRELELVAQQKKDRLERLLSAVDVVAQEEEVGRRGKAAHLKHPNEVGVLPMHVADDFDGGIQLEKRGLRQKGLAGAMANGHDLRILQAHALCDLSSICSIE